ncbi:hypothetical protein DFQ28_006978 [Apophysomyces sp. BC1034]|nr:hypothetical protein DFQ28_006978 [Apophysomyces sp. BC1034]
MLGHLLLLLVLAQALLGLSKTDAAKRIPFPAWFAHVPPSMHLILAWLGLLVAYGYLVLAALTFSESFESYAQALLPLAMGNGFLAYGTLVITHLLGILQLPRRSTPEYYEGLILAFWGLVNLLMSDTPVLGSDWRALNLGLLWFTGGAFSISISMQTWMPVIRERNIVNAVIVCLTGRAIIVGFTQDDPYVAQVHTMLGYIMVIGAIARVIQIVFRKSPTDNLPQLLCYRYPGYEANEDEEEDEEELQTMEQGRGSSHYHHQSAYQRLTGQSPPPCKHKSVFASITVICGLLASLMSMACGILFMGTNVGWIRHVRYYIEDPAMYVNMIMAATFLWACYVFVLCTIYKTTRAATDYDYLRLDSLDCVTMPPPPPRVASSPSTTDLLSHNQRYEERRDLHRTRSLPAKQDKSHYQQQKQQQQPPPMRPSQYRAKRRSLLVQSPTDTPLSSTNNHVQRIQSSSFSFGVGGILPDDIKDIRQSWLSNGSATSADSSSTSSGNLGGGCRSSRSSSSSCTSSLMKNQKSALFSEEPAQFFADDELRKTESGRRKERKQYWQGQQGDDDTNNSSGAGSGSEQHSVAKYFSSERNSSDSHVC